MDNLKDGYSYSEKIMYCLLCELDCDFTKEKSDFKWLKPWNKRYDFYFEKDGQEYIIETHGGQHYTNKGFSSLGGRTLEEEQENDKFKKELALKNNIKEENYIVIDCRKSELEFIKNNILHSRLNDVFDLDNVDWNEISLKSCTSEILKINNMYKNGLSIMEISKITKYGRDTIRDYLQRCKDSNLNDYDKSKSQCTSIEKKYNITDKDILDLYNNGYTCPKISKILGCHEDTVRNHVEYMSKKGLCIYDGYKNKITSKCRKVINNVSNKIYKSVTEASKESLIPMTTLRRYCNNKNNTMWSWF